jgi:hypothetical protein
MPRELIEPHKGDKRYVRRKGGEFTTRQTDVGRLLSADRRSKAKRVEQKGDGLLTWLALLGVVTLGAIIHVVGIARADRSQMGSSQQRGE